MLHQFTTCDSKECIDPLSFDIPPDWTISNISTLFESFYRCSFSWVRRLGNSTVNVVVRLSFKSNMWSAISSWVYMSNKLSSCTPFFLSNDKDSWVCWLELIDIHVQLTNHYRRRQPFCQAWYPSCCQILLEVLQILIYWVYKLMCHQINKSQFKYLFIGDWSLLIIFISTSVCKYYIVKLVVS